MLSEDRLEEGPEGKASAMGVPVLGCEGGVVVVLGLGVDAEGVEEAATAADALEKEWKGLT